MKLYGSILIDVAGEDILDRPGLFARVRKALGGNPDLRTGRMRAALEATAVVDAVRDALIELGATNAVSLVIDDLVVFQDRERQTDDLGDLFLAYHDHAAVIGGFGLLRLAVEHAEAGLHLVLEVQARTEHAREEPAVRVVISGRIQAFEPRPGEDAAAYRARVEPLARDRSIVEVARLAFDSFVGRARDAIARAMPEARARVATSEARVVVPDERADRKPRALAPTDPNYDPHDAYYPSPMFSMMSMAMLGMWMMPGMTLVNSANTPVGQAGEPTAEPTAGEAGQDDGGGLEGGDSEGGGFEAGDWGGVFEE
jgi:hypothetical protein